MPIPARVRLALLLTIAVYPLVTLGLYALGPLTQTWELWQRTLILVPVVSSSLAILISPFINRRFAKFIIGRKPIG
ncbi:hypothetical protein JHL21_12645 [Devosia sp. WQ 349]|uniref:hypothetical protein n=1 Tax=Devosia sp. WQ 349K1 TaxID=2800329 RepID=UPI0019060DCE|nr:hypothetical protein [Devosia sp. WQ 349K1]MBK1795345.1 hypothetical protein [Devosia sp. WQ 349K1]